VEAGLLGRVDVTVCDLDSVIDLSPFEIEFVSMSHSIPEANALKIKTDEGVQKVKNFLSKTPLKLVGQLSKFSGKAMKGFFSGLCSAFKTFSKK
jgi:ribonuclease J